MNKINHNKWLEYNTSSEATTDGTSDARGCEGPYSDSPVHASDTVERRAKSNLVS